jgi:hypothetical protein
MNPIMNTALNDGHSNVIISKLNMKSREKCKVHNLTNKKQVFYGLFSTIVTSKLGN